MALTQGWTSEGREPRCVAIAVDNVCAYQKVSELSDRLANEKLYLEEELQTQCKFDETC